MFAKIAWLCMLFTVGLIVWGGHCMVWSGDFRQHGGALIVEEPEQDIGEQTVGANSLELRVRNTSNRPRRVLGMTGH